MDKIHTIKAFGIAYEPIFEARLVRHNEQNTHYWLFTGSNHSGLVMATHINQVIEFLMRSYEVSSIQTNTGKTIIPEHVYVINLAKLIIVELEKSEVE